MRLTAATALDELGSLANHLTSVERMVLHEVVAHADVEHRFLVSYRAYNGEQVSRNSLTQLEHEILGSSRLQWEDSCDDLHAVHLACLSDEVVLCALYGSSLELLDVLLHSVVLLDVLADDALQVLCVVEQTADSLQHVLDVVHQLLTLLAGLCLDTADAGSYAALGDDLEHTDATCRLCVDTAAELAARAEAHYAHLVAVLLAEEGDSAELLSLLERSVAVLVEWQVLTDEVVDETLYLAQLLVSHLGEVREVETQRCGRYE